LLEKGYIRPSSPPCGAPVIFVPKKDGTQLVLVMPDVEKPVSIFCDASGQGLGCVLMQDGTVVAYAS
jgi:hypothetical protein